MEAFYRQLTGFTDIAQIADGRFYRPVPDDWYVSVVDVRGSTEAIERGNYRDVNFIGAAAITAQLNLVNPGLPFIFGGDGATVLVTEAMRSNTLNVLQSLSYHARESFALELHAGLVPVSTLRAMGKELQIAKYLSGKFVNQAMFKGGGMTLAEILVKNSAEFRCEPRPVFSKTEIFSGLTCRWQPVPSGNGVTLSILIQPRDEKDARVLPRVIARIEHLLGGSFASANPIRMDNARYHSFLHNLKRQLQASDIRCNRVFFRTLYELMMTVPLFNLKGFRWIPGMQRYVDRVPLHCDFKKYDDTLRMVLDCSPSGYRAIEEYLQSEQRLGRICFGIHVSDAAQMTCYVESMSDGGHLHFVDGTDGGYALAAKQLKQALSDSETQSA
ncbi:DUF3095 family protein [Amphritea pacifica]|uniref:DUF3095 family protein n=1 Tax=Amphritea pacifica TaxID=2811233 RepID=A0ABS2W2B8_9GAMM|nr:DUF3095 family protein [Amphritea pacifica]MBN0985861.1 DUF3095 family protein [Amphritea pacifica]MBN1005942.1 DUF3095 family protein [Amphritea pacifica]